MDCDDTKNDLPLMSNTNEISVHHYIFDFFCDFEQKCFSCTAVLFLEPVEPQVNCEKCKCEKSSVNHVIENSSNINSASATKTNESYSEICLLSERSKQDFVFVLDCYKINVDKVEELNLTTSEINLLKFSHSKLNSENSVALNYNVREWCLKIWKDGACCRFCFPRIIKINYSTAPEGSSLLWVTDQDKRPSVFTYGAWVNNRSLFPCQEPPAAMATWEATVTVPETDAIVLMSGDADATISESGRMLQYYYFTKTVLPMSTLALAIGFWKIHCIPFHERGSPSCRIISPSSLLLKSVKEFGGYLENSVCAAEHFLGPYPFPRIDVLLVPRGFGSLGMASPNLLFLSQSLICGDGSMCCRLAHEVSHGWFGLTIGAADWTEEWLSEGFATFMEDHVHARATEMSSAEAEEFMEIKSYLRWLTLKAEVENTAEDLQVLRRNQGKTLTATVDDVEAVILKEGKNPEKGFMQVHYIKGYFLLKYLSDLIGIDQFMHLLKCYVKEYKGQLVDSQALFKMFLQKHQEIDFKWTVDELFDRWLHAPGIPEDIKELQPSLTKNWFSTVMTETEKLRAANACYLKRKQRKRRKISLDDLSSISSEQKTVILENLLKEEKIARQVLSFLHRKYGFENANAEVRHRWCELVVKHRYKPAYSTLKDFLENDLAMGVYLYGEMIFSEIPQLKNMAKETFSLLRFEMEPNFVTAIDEMLQKENVE